MFSGVALGRNGNSLNARVCSYPSVFACARKLSEVSRIRELASATRTAIRIDAISIGTIAADQLSPCDATTAPTRGGPANCPIAEPCMSIPFAKPRVSTGARAAEAKRVAGIAPATKENRDALARTSTGLPSGSAKKYAELRIMTQPLHPTRVKGLHPFPRRAPPRMFPGILMATTAAVAIDACRRPAPNSEIRKLGNHTILIYRNTSWIGIKWYQ